MGKVWKKRTQHKRWIVKHAKAPEVATAERIVEPPPAPKAPVVEVPVRTTPKVVVTAETPAPEAPVTAIPVTKATVKTPPKKTARKRGKKSVK